MNNSMLDFYKNALLGNGSEKPLCGKYKDEWRACGNDKDKLMKLALRQQSLPFVISYASQGKGLTKEYLLDEFSEYINGNRVILDADGVSGYTYGMNVGLQRDFNVDTDVSAFLWCDCATVGIPKCKCPTIYVGCGSDLHLSLEGFNSIRIMLFDTSRVVIEDSDDESGVIVYRYSDDSIVECGSYCLCDVREFRKELRLQL